MHPPPPPVQIRWRIWRPLPQNWNEMAAFLYLNWGMLCCDWKEHRQIKKLANRIKYFFFILILVLACRTRETGHMTRGKICTIITSRNTSSRVCPVDFDGCREMSSLSLKTVVVYKSVTSLMMETNLRKGGLVHRVPWTKSREKLQKLFQSVRVLFCKYDHCNQF